MTQAGCTEVVVRGRGRLNTADLDQHLRVTRTLEIQLDLRELTFIEPAGLVSLAVISELASISGRPIEFHAPVSVDVATYLSRMRLGDHLDSLGISHDLPAVNERNVGAQLVELHRFDGPEGMDRVVDALMQTFIREHPDSVQPLYTALHEVATNVVQHSRCGHGYAALQRFPGRDDVAFAVADGGIGLRGSLSTKFQVSDDRVAIVLAAETHVSTMDQPGRGRGIARVISVTGTHRGEVTLFSGKARGVFGHGNPHPQLTNLLSAHPGTLAVARLSL